MTKATDVDARTLKRLRSRGTLMVVAGGFLLIHGTAFLCFLVPDIPDLLRYPLSGIFAPRGFVVGVPVFLGVCFFYSLWGLGLAVTGVGIRRGREWARRCAIGLLWVWIIFYGACGIGTVMSAFSPMASPAARLVNLAMGAVVTVAALWFLLRMRRFFTSADVQRTCAEMTSAAGGTADQRRRSRTLLSLVYGVGFGLPVLAYGAWWWTSARALDRELARLAASDPPRPYEAWKPAPPPREDNAADLVRLAAVAIQEADEAIKAADLKEPPVEWPHHFFGWRGLTRLDIWTPEEAAYAWAVQPYLENALSLVHQAAEKPVLHFDWDCSRGALLEFPGLQNFQLAASLARFSAKFHLYTKEYEEALRDIRVLLWIARFPRDPIEGAQWVRRSHLEAGVRCTERALATEGFQTILLADLDAPLREAAGGADLADVLRAERDLCLEYKDEILAGDWEAFMPEYVKAWKKVANRGGELHLTPAGHRRLRKAKAAFMRPAIRGGLVLMLRYYGDAIRAAEAGPSDASPQRGGVSPRWEPRHEISLLAIEGSLSVVPGEFWHVDDGESYAEARALADALRVAIALRRSKADAGRSAERLAVLAPRYLPEVPRDPFTGKDFLVKREDGWLTVYSLGQGLTDDGGHVHDEDDLPTDVGVRIRE